MLKTTLWEINKKLTQMWKNMGVMLSRTQKEVKKQLISNARKETLVIVPML